MLVKRFPYHSLINDMISLRKHHKMGVSVITHSFVFKSALDQFYFLGSREFIDICNYKVRIC